MRSDRAGFLAQLRVGGAGRAGSARGVSRSPSRERAHACGEAWGLVLCRGSDQTSTYIKIAEARILIIGKVRGEKPERALCCRTGTADTGVNARCAVYVDRQK